MRLSILSAASLLVVLSLLPDSLVRAQRIPSNRPRALPLRGSGNVLAMQPGFLRIDTAAGGEWILKVEAPPDKIVVQGEAVPSWLRPGMFVRFSAELNRKGIAQAPVEELFVFTPSPQYRIGVFPESDLLFEENDPQEKATRKRRQARTEGRYLVAGRLTSIRKGTLRVAAGETVNAPIAENAKIRVDILGSYQMVRAGDKVEFEGHYFEKGKAAVRSVTFTAAAPFGSEDLQAADRSSRSKRGRRQRAEEGSAEETSTQERSTDEKPS